MTDKPVALTTPPPPLPTATNKLLSFGFFALAIFLLFSFLNSPGISKQPVEQGSNSYRIRQNIIPELPAIWVEYSGETVLSYKVELELESGIFEQLEVGLQLLPTTHTIIGCPIGQICPVPDTFVPTLGAQICGVQPDCVPDQPEPNVNYFEGTANTTDGWLRGGLLEPGDFDFWIVPYPDPLDEISSRFFRVRFVLTTQGIKQYPSAVNRIRSQSYSRTEIGFKTTPVIVVALATPNQYQVSWPNPLRYEPNPNGLVNSNSAVKGIDDKTTYWIQTDIDQNFTNPQETEIGPSELTISNNRYQHTINHNHPTNTPIWTRIYYQETRFDQTYNIYSQPVSTPTTPTTSHTPPTTMPSTIPTTPTTQPTPTIVIGTPTTNPSEEQTPQPPATSPPTPPRGIVPIPPVSNQPAPNVENPDQIPAPEFTDTSQTVHQTNIRQLAEMGVTRGCNPPENSHYCPERAVTRAEMATFLVRAFELPPTDEDPFTDTAGNVHRTNINRMAAAGISRGCNPPTNDEFCPDRAVTRAEMATFMTRVLELTEKGSGFTDTTGNVHSTNIARFSTAGITRGCNPPSNTRYCPDRAVTRGEMATFLVRSSALTNS